MIMINYNVIKMSRCCKDEIYLYLKLRKLYRKDELHLYHTGIKLMITELEGLQRNIEI